MELSYYAGALFYTKIHETEVFQMKEIWNWIQLAIAAIGALQHRGQRWCPTDGSNFLLP